jgi:hypothetical protein
MRSFTVLTALLASLDLAVAHPGMGQQLEGLMSLKERQATPELLGDLLTLSDAELTPTGAAIKGMLLGTVPTQDTTTFYSPAQPPQLGSKACDLDKCCVWKWIADEMRNNMVGTAGRCTDLARAAVRLGFHDAGAWSKSTGRGGGADGSIVLARECENRPDNNGLQGICNQMRVWHDRWKVHGISMADLIQMAANVATVVCPLGPRVRTFVGRKDSSVPAPEGLLPSPFQSVDELLAMFADKTISGAQLVALVGAHSTSQQRFVDQARAGDPQDSTPGVWDVKFYEETTNPNSPQRVFKFQSDVLLAQDARTSGTWQAFSGTNGQRAWNGGYARAYVRLSLLGVYNINDLIECTSVLPAPVLTGDFLDDKAEIKEFLHGEPDKETADALLDGDFVPAFDA